MPFDRNSRVAQFYEITSEKNIKNKFVVSCHKLLYYLYDTIYKIIMSMIEYYLSYDDL